MQLANVLKFEQDEFHLMQQRILFQPLLALQQVNLLYSHIPILFFDKLSELGIHFLLVIRLFEVHILNMLYRQIPAIQDLTRNVLL